MGYGQPPWHWGEPYLETHARPIGGSPGRWEGSPMTASLIHIAHANALAAERSRSRRRHYR